MSTIFIGISAWIIQDGNYPDFHSGDKAEFSLEFFPLKLGLSSSSTHYCKHIKANQYRVRARVIYTSEPAWVIDVGVMAYQNHKTPEYAGMNLWLEGDIYLSVDPFFYKEELYKLQGIPSLRYAWRIKRILLETTPWIYSPDEMGRPQRMRDKSRESFVDVVETNAWKDDEGNAHYVLECEEELDGKG